MLAVNVLWLLRGGIAQGVPSTATIIWSIVRSPADFLLFLFHTPVLSGKYQQGYLVAKREKFGDKVFFNFADNAYILYSAGFYNIP
jgi:hypothetical protein